MQVSLHGLRKGGQEADVSQLLIEEMVAEQPTLLPLPPQAASDHASLPAPKTNLDRQVEEWRFCACWTAATGQFY
jgi:hypothetical protein